MVPIVRRGVFGMVLALLAARADAGNVYTVGGSFSDFDDLPAAVAAATDGDVLLVRSGTYSGFTIDNKSLVVAADTGAVVDIAGLITIQNLTAGDGVALLGIRAIGDFSNQFQSSGYLHVWNVSSLRVESCQFGQVNTPYHSSHSQPAVAMAYVDQASFVDCSIYGEDGTAAVYFGDPDDGAPALVENTCSLALYDCRLIGGNGLSGSGDTGHAGGDGADGLQFEHAEFLFASGVTFRGGTGGDGSDASDCIAPPAGPGGSGGSGISVPFGAAAGSIVLLDCTPTGGQGGAGGIDQCGPNGSDGADGVPIIAYGGIVQQLSIPYRRLVMPTVARESTVVPLTFTGVPGERVYLTMWSNSGYSYRPSLNGVLLEAPPLLRRLFLGVVPASGVLQSQISMPDLGIGVEERTLFLQAIAQGPAGELTLGSAATLVVLDSAF